jgi:hypothetical protein
MENLPYLGIRESPASQLWEINREVDEVKSVAILETTARPVTHCPSLIRLRKLEL